MKNSNGFNYRQTFVDGVRSLEYSMKNKVKNPLYWEMELRGPGAWDRKNGKLVQEIHDKIEKRAERVFARYQKFVDFAAKQNIKLAKSITPEELLEKFLDIERGNLHWFEKLPIGITKQMAANLTNITFWDSCWRGNTQISVMYSPNTKEKTTKRRAARI
jgi:hypothetical protein